MTEFDEQNSFSISTYSNKEEDTNFNSEENKIDEKNYPIRCSDCSNIATLKADFKKNIFYTMCDNHHINEYKSFSSFIKEANKNFDNILCNECKNSNDGLNIFRCNTCNLFLCIDCKSIHTEKYEHKEFEELNKIDNHCPIHHEKFKYFNKHRKYHLCESCYNSLGEHENIIEINQFLETEENINKEYMKAMENITICQNIQKSFNNWLDMLSSKIQNYCDTLHNYCLLQKTIINFLKSDNNNKEIYSNNFNVIMNYEAFSNNKDIVDTYLQQIQDKLNNLHSENVDFEKMSENYINILNDFSEITLSVDCEKIKEDNMKKTNIKKLPNFPKIEKMKKLKLPLKSEAKCFSSLNKEKNIVLGLANGAIEIYEFAKQDSFKYRLTIREFNKEIKFINEIDENIFAATDGKTCIKIFEYKSENNKNDYNLIQTIDLNSENIYSMISLPILSSNANRHYFCAGDEENILIWKSNRQPKNIQIPYFNKNEEDEELNISLTDISFHEIQKEENVSNDEPLYFTLVKTIKLNTLSRSLIEINDKYLACACSKTNTIKIFDITKDFELKTEFRNIMASAGSDIFSLIPKLNILIVGCVDGFCFISTQNLKIVKNIRCTYSVTSLECSSNNSFVCCCSDKNENKIRQYIIDDFTFSIKKSSEKKCHSYEIWNLKSINDKLFFTNNDNYVSFLR